MLTLRFATYVVDIVCNFLYYFDKVVEWAIGSSEDSIEEDKLVISSKRLVSLIAYISIT